MPKPEAPCSDHPQPKSGPQDHARDFTICRRSDATVGGLMIPEFMDDYPRADD